MADYAREMAALARGLELARRETVKLTTALGRSSDGLPEKSGSAACSGGSCSADGSAGTSGGSGATAGVLARSISGGLASAIRGAISGDLKQALRSMISSMVRSFASFAGRSAGGGLGGSLVSSLIGGGLSLLAGRLFRRRQRVAVDNTVRAEVLNFPRYTGLDFAANPASRLFGGRAVARGPAFTVEVAYRDGAEDVVAAKVTTKLADLNSLQGVV